MLLAMLRQGGRTQRQRLGVVRGLTKKSAAWEALDALETAERVRLSAIMAALRRRQTPDDPEQQQQPLKAVVRAEREVLQETYPPSRESCAALLEHLRHGGRVSGRFASRVFKGASDLFKEKEPRLRCAKALRTVIVGDLHGSVLDLCAAMEIAGSPKSGKDSKNEVSNLVVFNGDFVDRGSRSTEVLVAVLALKLAFGDGVHVNRGNHEDVELSKVYDFERELFENFGDEEAAQLLATADICFSYMPLALVVNDETLVLHGHLPRTLPTLEAFSAFPCTRSLASAHYTVTEDETLLVQDILWGDPDHDGRVNGDFEQNVRRGGAGVVVSDAALRRYLTIHNLRRLVRSHEVSANGAECTKIGHMKERWTVFSCAKYPYSEGLNKGAVVVLDNRGNCHPRRWTGQREEGEAKLSSSFDARVRGLLRRHRSLLRSIADSQPSLDAAEACCEAFNAAKDADLWRHVLLPAATKQDLVSASDVADLASTLTFEKLASQQKDARIQARHAATKHRRSASKAFEALDHNKDGIISFDEFKTFLDSHLPHLQPHDADAAWLFLDTDDSGFLDTLEFHRGFLFQ